jgi:HAMP domain-containing protein
MIRRLIGPTLIVLVLSGLIADHLFFRESPWSVVSFLSKVVSTIGAIFGPALNPSLYGWASEIAIPVSMIVIAVVLLSVTVGRAKVAMSKATPNAGTPMAQSLSTAPMLPKPVTMQDRERSAVPDMPRQFGLISKLTLSFGSIGVIFGVAACVIVYSFLCRVFEKETKSRADATAISIHAMAARQLGSRNAQALQAGVAKYALDNGVAYIYVEDREGKIVAHTPRDLPMYLNRDFPSSGERALHGADLQYRGLGVYEIAKRIGDGNTGFVHLGIWRAVIEQEARLAVTPVAASIFAVLLGVVGVFVSVTRHVNRPFLEVVEHAERISKGDFAAALGVKRSDEIGEIARSLERMRSSLSAAATRLEQGQLTQQSGK